MGNTTGTASPSCTRQVLQAAQGHSLFGGAGIVLHAAENGLRDPLGKRLLPSGKHTKNGKIAKTHHFWWVNQSTISMGHVAVRYVSHYQRVNVNPQVQKIEVLKYLAKVDPINPGKKNASFLNITHLNLKISLVISQPILDTQQQIRYIIPYQKTKGLVSTHLRLP